MKNNFTKNYKYLISSQRDEDWDINVNTVGCETIEKNYETYPPRTGRRVAENWTAINFYI